MYNCIFCICMSYTLVVIAVVYCNHILVGRGTVCTHDGVPVKILPELAMVGDSLSKHQSIVMHCLEMGGWGGCCILV